jgi:colicin import membrane protein
MEVHPGDFKIIIGPKGETIRTIQTDSGCNIDTDKDNCTVAFRGTEEQCAKGKELVDALLEAETVEREKRMEENKKWQEEEDKKWAEEKAAKKAAKAAAGGPDSDEEEEVAEEGGDVVRKQFAVNPFGGDGTNVANSPRSKSAAKRARKKAGKSGGPTNIDDMSDAQVLDLLLGSDSKKAEAAKAKLQANKEKEEAKAAKEEEAKAAKKAKAKAAFEAKEKAEEEAKQAEFRRLNAKFSMRL